MTLLFPLFFSYLFSKVLTLILTLTDIPHMTVLPHMTRLWFQFNFMLCINALVFFPPLDIISRACVVYIAQTCCPTTAILNSCHNQYLVWFGKSERRRCSSPTQWHILEELLASCGGVAAVGGVIGAVWCVPGVVAALPGKLCLEGAEEIIKSPGDDNIVVGAQYEGDCHWCHAHSWGETKNTSK